MTAPMNVQDRFEAPSILWYVALDGGIGVMKAMALSQDVYDKVAEQVPVPPRKTIQAMLVGTVVLHAAESALAYRMAKKRGLTESAGRYARHAFIVGFPVLLKIRQVSR